MFYLSSFIFHRSSLPYPHIILIVKVLVTGGAGYIGSHTVLELVEGGHEPVILDNFSNSSRKILPRLEELSGRRIELEEGDVRDFDRIVDIIRDHQIEAVIHFAAYKAVGESWEKPLDYFDNNISGTVRLLRAMREANVRRLVFSSSCTVYGDARNPPISEDAPLQVANPYGRTKLVMEQLIGDVCEAHHDFRAAILRYFNPVGAHPSGRIGEDPLGEPNNLMPYVTQVAVGRRESVRVFGNDYPTRDGSGVRDYIHVVDLAHAHLAALDYLVREDRSITVNLGTGRGYSVLEVIRTFEKATGQTVPYEIVGRRPGDVAELYADPTLARALLGWEAEHDLEQMCRDAWRWQKENPEGY